jgi:hypothetical protein
MCSVTATYKSGASTATGLEPKVADTDGIVAWSWLVGTNTTPGSRPIAVTCSLGGQSATPQTSLAVT